MNVPLVGWALLGNHPDTKGLAVDGTRLYQYRSTGHVYRYTGTPLTGWQELDDTPDTMGLAAAGGRLYQLKESGVIRLLVE
jgi:hypothetical protein